MAAVARTSVLTVVPATADLTQLQVPHFLFLPTLDFSLHPWTEGRTPSHRIWWEYNCSYACFKHIAFNIPRETYSDDRLQGWVGTSWQPFTTAGTGPVTQFIPQLLSPLCFSNQASACQQLYKLQTSDHIFHQFYHQCNFFLDILN